MSQRSRGYYLRLWVNLLKVETTFAITGNLNGPDRTGDYENRTKTVFVPAGHIPLLVAEKQCHSLCGDGTMASGLT